MLYREYYNNYECNTFFISCAEQDLNLRWGYSPARLKVWSLRPNSTHRRSYFSQSPKFLIASFGTSILPLLLGLEFLTATTTGFLVIFPCNRASGFMASNTIYHQNLTLGALCHFSLLLEDMIATKQISGNRIYHQLPDKFYHLFEIFWRIEIHFCKSSRNE